MIRSSWSRLHPSDVQSRRDAGGIEAPCPAAETPCPAAETPCPEELLLLLLLPPTSLSTAPSCSHNKGPQAEGRAKVRGVQRGGASRQGPRQWFRQRI